MTTRKTNGMGGLNPFKLALGTVFMLSLLAAQASALKNPVGVYCDRMGYQQVNDNGPQGAEVYCIMPDGTKCLAANFTMGVCGSEFSYCVKNGFGLKKGVDSEAKCVLNDGTEEWVTVLITQDDRYGGPYVEEKISSPCGDGVCFQDETVESCPQDCVNAPSVTIPTMTSSTSTSSTSSTSSTETTLETPETPQITPTEQPATLNITLYVIAAILILILLIYEYKTRNN